MTAVRRHTVRAVALALACCVGAVAAAGPASASSHREAPLTAASPLVDGTDTFAFVSPDAPDTVTLLAGYTPFQDPASGPEFSAFGADGYRYEIAVDTNGDAKADRTYRWTFSTEDRRAGTTFRYADGPVRSLDDPHLLFRQTYRLEVVDAAGRPTTLLDGAAVAPSRVGDATMPDYPALRKAAVLPLQGANGLAFAGPAADPFFADLRLFDLLYGGNLSETGHDSLAGYNVSSLGVQVPLSDLTRGGDGSGIIGVWSTAWRRALSTTPASPAGPADFVQVSRVGAPLVNELVLPAGLKDAFNAMRPDQDAAATQVLERVRTPELPRLVADAYRVPVPATPRDDLVAAYLTGVKGLNQPPSVTPSEQLRLNTRIHPAARAERLGVLARDTAGYPNGRRPGDDVVDITLQVLEGALRSGAPVAALAPGDRVDAGDAALSPSFPYLALPHSGSAVTGRGTGGTSGSSGTGGGAATGGTSGGAALRPRGVAPLGGVAAGFGGSSQPLPLLPTTVALLGVTLVGAGLRHLRRGR